MKSVLVPSTIRDWRLQEKIELALQALSLFFVAWLALAFLPAALTMATNASPLALCFMVLCFLPPLWIAYRYGWRSALAATGGMVLLLVAGSLWHSPAPGQWPAWLLSLALLSIPPLLVGHTISQDRHKESKAQNERARMHVVMDSLPVLVAYVGADQRYQYHNRTYHHWFNHQLTAVDGQLVSEVIGDVAYQAVCHGIQRALEQNRSQRQEFHIGASFGKDIWLDCQAAPLTADSHKDLLMVIDDITQRKAAEAELARHRGQLEELVSERTTDLRLANEQLQQMVAERVRIEKALMDSEEHFRLLAENAHDTIFRYDLLPQPHLVYVSPAVVNLTGFTVAEVMADPNFGHRMIAPEDARRLAQVMAAPQEYPGPIEVRWRQKDGKMIWIEQRHVAIYDEAGRCATIIGITRDITERRQADEQLRKLSRAVEQSRILITITDVEGNIEYVNPHFSQVTGFSAQDVLGKKPRFMDNPNGLSKEVAELLHTLQSGLEWHGELHNKTKSGNTYWEAGVVSPIHDSQGQTTHYVAVMEDITHRKQQERERKAFLAVSLALRAAANIEEMLGVVLQEISTTFNAERCFFVAPDPVTNEMVVRAVYADGVYRTDVNFRIPPGKGVANHVYQSGQPYVTTNALVDPLFAAPEMLGAAHAVACVPLIAKDEPIGLFSLASATPLSNGDVRLLSALADMAASGLQRAAYHEETLRYAANLEREVAEQTRELREANERLQELDRLKSKFVSDVSHELRTPVTNMSLYLKLLRRKPEKQEQYLTILQEEAVRLETLVLEILNLAQLDNKPAPALDSIDLNELLAGVVAAHQARAESHQLELTFQADAALPPILGDANKLIQVATNLLANAINYTPSGYVRVRTCALDAAQVCFMVEDSGTGIYAEDIPHLFDRFYRGRRDQITDVPGTGLGLSIVKELVELHGGSIQVDSLIRKGTTITVTLPTSFTIQAVRTT